MQNKYHEVYFRIESGYMTEWENREAFYAEVEQLFSVCGWTIERGICNSKYLVSGKSKLHIHPQSLSGAVSIDKINEVEEILLRGKTFKYTTTDIYKELFDMSDEEYLAKLTEQKQDIINELINGFKTKRKNLFISNHGSVIENVKEKFHIARLSRYLTRTSDDVEWKYVQSLFEEIKKNGSLLSAKTKYGIGYRAAS